MKRGIGCGVLLLVLTGCVSIEEYPKNWPAIAASPPDGCTAIAGSYVSLGKGYELGLNMLAGERRYGKDAQNVELADHMEISVPRQGALVIAAYHQDKLVARRQSSEQDKTLTCGPDSAVLYEEGQFQFGEGVVAYEKITSITLAKDKEGALIAKTESWGIGAYGIIPLIFLKGVHWERFPVKQAPPG